MKQFIVNRYVLKLSWFFLSIWILAAGLLIILLAMGIIYGICQQYFDIGQQYYMYTPSWTLRNVLWFAALISVTSSLFGRYCFSIITLAGYILGVITGEMFGGFKSHIPPEYLHYGWVIWGSVYILSSIIGILVEILIRQRHKTVT